MSHNDRTVTVDLQIMPKSSPEDPQFKHVNAAITTIAASGLHHTGKFIFIINIRKYK